MSHILKNQTASDIVLDIGRTIPASGQYTIDIANLVPFQTSNDVVTYIASGDVLYNDGVNDYSDSSEALRLLNGGTHSVSIREIPPFAAKTKDGEKLFSRSHGVKYTVAVGSNTPNFVVPYVSCLFNEIEIIGGEKGDYVDLFILDTATGTVTTIPNYPLNEFGFEVFVAEGFYKRGSNYDAALFLGLQINMVYYSISAKDIYVNYILHELKT